jgi:type I restriction enzyme, S subunit
MKAGWEIKKLGELCDFEGGSQPPKSEFIYDEKPGYVRFLQIRDFGSDKNITYIYQSKKNRLCNKSDIMIGRYGASVGKILTGKTGAYNVALMKTIPNLEVLDRSWFHKYLISDEFQKPLLNVADRSAQAGFSKDDIYNFSVPVPPLPEQQRIVTILDEAFDGIATAKANAEKNLQNARALFESHLQSVFTQRGEGWVDTTLGAEIDLLAGFAFKSSQYTDSDNSVRLLRGDNIVQGSLRWEDVKKWPISDTKEYKRYELCDGDVVLAMDRPWIKAGLKRAQITSDDLPCLLVQRTARLRGCSSLDNRFLVYLISSDAFTQHILGIQTGIGVPHISGQQIKDFQFLKPPIKEQIRMTGLLDNLTEETQRLESICQQKLAAFEALKKSLLDQAFTGQL